MSTKQRIEAVVELPVEVSGYVEATSNGWAVTNMKIMVGKQDVTALVHESERGALEETLISDYEYESRHNG